MTYEIAAVSPSEIFSKNMRVVRRQKKKTQKEVAEAVGVSRVLIAMIETQRVSLKLDHAINISNFLGVTLERMLVQS